MSNETTQADVKVGVRTRNLSEPRLKFIRQLGATDIFVDHADTEEEPDEFNDQETEFTIEVGRDAIPSIEKLEYACNHVDDLGLTLRGIQSLPYSLYGDIMFARDGEEEALKQIKTLIRNLGEADIPSSGTSESSRRRSDANGARRNTRRRRRDCLRPG